MTNTVDTTVQYILMLTGCFREGDIDAAILAILFDLGFSTQCEGFSQLRIAIRCRYDRPQSNCHEVYEAVIRGTDPSATEPQIEQTIRSAISSAWSRGPDERWDLLFPAGKNGRRNRPSNFEFISRIACILELWSSARNASD
jgi:hypothetical protein